MKDSYPYKLSICIPTYNRVDTLRKSLISIVNNRSFGEDIEVVVSDNNSSDNTREVVLEYASKYPNIHYFKNESNLGGDRNILLSLQRGKGCFLKIINDYSIFSEDGIDYLLRVINEFQCHPVAIFFNSKSKVGFSVKEYNSFDSFVEDAGWTMSWIGNHGFWKSDLDSWKDLDKYIDLKFMQVDWLIRSFLKYQSGIICTANLTYRLSTLSKQGDYNFFKIHTDNYFSLFRKCVDDHCLSEKSYRVLQRKVLRGLLLWVYTLCFERGRQYSYSTDNGIKHLFSIYWKFPWFYYEIALSVPIYFAKKIRDKFQK